MDGPHSGVSFSSDSEYQKRAQPTSVHRPSLRQIPLDLTWPAVRVEMIHPGQPRVGEQGVVLKLHAQKVKVATHVAIYFPARVQEILAEHWKNGYQEANDRSCGRRSRFARARLRLGILQVEGRRGGPYLGPWAAPQ
ncbi:hypothetical protein EVAR_69810_1 [Eumeta japonica]|uniref:Uncharacterized protein n=1 Tax=Eumeta variegata TaxID=151549 RepID=A0A4C1Z2M1_EUMVA|nr:hypothetical protein EVAR_69810_1 [Eumeta japonica]